MSWFVRKFRGPILTARQITQLGPVNRPQNRHGHACISGLALLAAKGDTNIFSHMPSLPMKKYAFVSFRPGLYNPPHS